MRVRRGAPGHYARAMTTLRVALAALLWSAIARAQDIRLPTEPTVLAPGVVSTPGEEFKATVSPDGLTLLYVKTEDRFQHMAIFESHRRSPTAAWEAPVVASFSGVYKDGDPAFAPDGTRLLFISRRPTSGTTVRPGFALWSVPRRADGRWGTPTLIDPSLVSDTSEFAPSLTSRNVLYFGRGGHIYRVAPGGHPEMLPFEGGDPAIAADERYLVFDNNNGDLYASCRTASGWSAPRRFAPPINTPAEEGDPWISADGRTMYFYSTRSKATRVLYSVDVSAFTCD
jgi:Tol biopolymer transport system component